MLDLIDDELREEFFEEFKELSRDVEEYLLKLEKEPDNKTYIRELFRPFHTIKGNAGLIGEKEIQTISQLSESILDEVRQGRQAITQKMLDVCLHSVDLIKEISVLRNPKELASQIESVQSELQSVLDSFKPKTALNLSRKLTQSQTNQNTFSLDHDHIKNLIRTLKEMDYLIDHMKERGDFAYYLPDTFDIILDLSCLIPKTRTTHLIRSITSYMQIYLTALNLEEAVTFSLEKWDLLNTMRNDLLFQLFPLCTGNLKVKIIYYSEDDLTEEIIEETSSLLADQINYIIIYLNLHHKPVKKDLGILFKLSQKYEGHIHFVNRYMGKEEIIDSRIFQAEEIPDIHRNFWQVLYLISEKA